MCWKSSKANRFPFSWSIPTRSCNRARCACLSTSAPTSCVTSRLADAFTPRDGAAHSATLVAQRFVQDAREPQAGDRKLLVHDCKALVVIVILEVMTGRQHIGNLHGRLVRFIRPVRRLSA